ncbi:hypothetical protein [Pseudomonas donghuensis]|uniref:hypothetical protein n=1 Tax=Pseudomonas donghuensis TaxID=1163398 RepID=UPI002E1355BD|nr:hypothetical protein VP780_10510 [Pseudomonas donghuensis]
MKIKLSPIRLDGTLEVFKDGDQLTLNGEVLDFGPLQDGATLPAEAITCRWINDPVERIAGELVVTITMPHGANAGQQSRFPLDILNLADGRVALPTDSDPQPPMEPAE